MKHTFKKGIAILLSILFAFNLSVVSFAEDTVMSGSCGENTEWVYDAENFTLTISGVGEIEDNYTGWNEFKANVKKVIINDGITRVGNEAFVSFFELEDITFPETLTSLGKRVFLFCYAISEVTIPKGVTVIDERTFSICHGLEKVTLLGDVKEIREQAFNECISLSDINFPESIRLIGSGAFRSCKKLENVVLPDSLEFIDSGAFNACPLTETFKIPGGVTEIGEGAFTSCSKIKNLVISDGVEKIGPSAFSYCTALENITVPDSVTQVGKDAFKNTAYYKETSNWNGEVFYIGKNLCEARKTIAGSYSIEPGTKSITDEAFMDCKSLVEVYIPDGVLTVGSQAFYGCSSLKKLTVPDSVSYIGHYAFNSTAYFNDDSNWEDDLLYIGKNVCAADWGIRGECTIKEGTKSISEAAFDGCNRLTKIKIPYGLTKIGSRAFGACSSLKEVTLPATVKVIEAYAFNSIEIATVNFIGTQEDWEEISIAGSNDSLYNNIVFNYGLNGACGEDAAWNFDTKSETLTISGTGAVSDYSDWNDIAHAVTYVEIEDGITSVGENTFSSFGALEEVYMAESVSELGADAFAGCPKLVTVTALSDELSFSNAFSGNDSRLFFVAKADSGTYNALKSTGFTVNGISTDKEKDGRKVLSFDGKTTIYQSLDYNYISNLVADNSDAYYLYFDKITFEGIASDKIIIDIENIDSAEEYFTLNKVYISVSVNGKTVSLPELIQLLQDEDADGIISFEEEEGETFFEMLSDFFEETVGEFVVQAFKVIKTVINAIRKLFK